MAETPQSDPNTTDPGAVGVVVIGDTATARPYLEAVSNLSRARVVGHLDLSEDDRAGIAGHVELRTTAPTIAAGWKGVDAYIHCGPLAGHPEAVAVIAASGKPVFVASRGGRNRADAQTVRGRIEAGEIGHVVFARFAAGNRSSDDAASTAHPDGDHMTWQQRGHALDMLGWWIGESPVTVYAQQQPDYESVTVRYSDGATAVCDISTGGPDYREVVVVGTSASMSLTWADHPSVLLPADGTGARWADGQPSLVAVVDAWLERVSSGTASIVDAAELEGAMALEEAVERSFASGGVVDVETSRRDRRQS